MGTGYVADYYEDLAADFIGIAERYAQCRVQEATEEWKKNGL